MSQAEQFQMMMKNIANTVMIPDKTIKNVDVNEDGKIDGYQFNFKNPFYTAEPISAIEDFLITIDGEKVDPKKVTLKVREQEILASQAKTVYEIWMGLGEVIPVYVEKAGGLAKGEHEMELILHLRTTVPYGFEEGGYITYPANVKVTAE